MKNQIIEQIRENLIDIIPELEGTTISNDETLLNIGANSIDRAELIALTLEQLEKEIPRIELAGAQTINELAELIASK
ncbi:phosphopantetheine-binding protein [Flavobacterium poyangense]|uniref:phosphopantetheine-binding protein n=1 Tax=Flavobacterium poyangense TaxID=2204302 RepID=UPI00141E3F05|nr:phosphopantetheine-binding protein [Flavobacterium sp. JXAS1]